MKPSRYYTENRYEMLEFVPLTSMKILEIGCGDGSFAALVKKKLKSEVWGIELEEIPALMAKEKLDKVLIGDFQLVKEHLPEHYFDCIIMNDVLEHFTRPEIILEHVKKFLSSSGTIVCSIPNVRYFDNLYEVLVKKDWEYKPSGILDATHYRFFTKKSIVSMFQNVGYDVVQIKGINKTFLSKKKKVFSRFLNLILLNFIEDTFYLQFACVAKLKK